ncbi:hypothetical protein [Azohydromonas caseinilytica]|uniref:Uncharacterized protein n=1 Tax=Azohydromonas caseinilytica TaxID=2728836 RepID=A0A848FBT8_9BURK|nr:hypothetical protein [Azohydromonas caseinilytica]NML15899.1 hypothetical protein [Azohydromonas caseinilytica]
MHRSEFRTRAASLALGLAALTAQAALPAPTPEQQAAAAAKAAQAASAAALEKQQLEASMDRLSQRWRQRAAAQGWPVNAPTPVAAAQVGTSGGSGSAQVPGQGNPHSAPGTPAAGAASAPPVPIRSEKLGTAPPSEDVKKPKTPLAR